MFKRALRSGTESRDVEFALVKAYEKHFQRFWVFSITEMNGDVLRIGAQMNVCVMSIAPCGLVASSSPAHSARTRPVSASFSVRYRIVTRSEECIAELLHRCSWIVPPRSQRRERAVVPAPAPSLKTPTSGKVSSP